MAGNKNFCSLRNTKTFFTTAIELFEGKEKSRKRRTIKHFLNKKEKKMLRLLLILAVAFLAIVLFLEGWKSYRAGGLDEEIKEERIRQEKRRRQRGLNKQKRRESLEQKIFALKNFFQRK